MESSQNGHTAPELPRVCQLLPGIHKRICGQGVPDAEAVRNKGKKFEWNDEAQVAFENIQRELCEAPVLGMPTEKGMYVLDTDASVVAISGILHQEQEWNGRTVLRPIAYGSKVLSNTEMKYGAPKAEMFAPSWKSTAHTGERSLQVTRGQQSLILVEDLLDGSELYW